jgi:hypothetical protein
MKQNRDNGLKIANHQVATIAGFSNGGDGFIK